MAGRTEFRIVGPEDVEILLDLFGGIRDRFFRPHAFTAAEARLIAERNGRDVYGILLADDRAVGYGMLRGWDEGFDVPSLGVAVRADARRQGFGRLTMIHLHTEAARRGAHRVRLRVHPENLHARGLYDSLGYKVVGEDRGELVMIVDLGLEAPTIPAEHRRP